MDQLSGLVCKLGLRAQVAQQRHLFPAIEPLIKIVTVSLGKEVT